MVSLRDLAPEGYPVGVGWNVAPDNSSNRTNWPAANPLALAIVTDMAPCVPSTVRFCDVLLSGPGQLGRADDDDRLCVVSIAARIDWY